ncbi:deformed epidermal autoregulatory factor 1 [Neocloeon triangulifer]|uniref:deformed epidermal autoregulatory factor 1 n=1 Tax=Neocloeon triangulifer TaxID=2078957 RepID=UPI00286F1C00|nr:deformed epidermal autoregulatory factor 1 [Neocloeon triangulifer]
MEEDRNSSATVVLPDISETDDGIATANDEELESRGQSVRVSTGGNVVTVPVQLGVGNGTTFNVITQDSGHGLQLQSGDFKPVLCVDNSFLCDRPDKDTAETIRNWVRSAQGIHCLQNGELKGTHTIVIQSDGEVAASSNVPQTPPTPREACNNSWNESVHQPVLPVRCKNTSAELHKERFGSGGRGKCIKVGNNWYTPSEFEALCGRASSKDWKRSIRFGGRSLQTLIDENILTPHATSCTCSACCDDDSAAGPIRLFTPYKRRKRKYTGDGPLTKRGKDISGGEDSNGGSCNDDESNADNAVDSIMHVGDPDDSDFLVGTADQKMSKLEEYGCRILKLAQGFKSQLEKVKETYKQEVEELRERFAREKEQAIMNAKLETQVVCSRAVFDTRSNEPIPVHVVDSLEPACLQPSTESDENKKCANCNREAFAECSLCRRTPYCSTFCQRKDWAAHQGECIRTGDGNGITQTGSIMLIVEGPDGQVISTSGPQ